MAEIRNFSREELLRIGKTYLCPVHPERNLRGFCVDDSTFGCQECIDDKPEEFKVERIKSAQRAVLIIETLFPKYPCAEHHQESTFFCMSENSEKCPDCVSETCRTKSHDIFTLEDLYLEKITKIQEITDSLSEFDQDHVAEIASALHQFEERETIRVNEEFDAYIEMINRKRKETLEALTKVIPEYYKRVGLLHAEDWEGWPTQAEALKEMDVLNLVKQSSLGPLKTKISAISESLRKFDDTYTRLVIKQELHSKTFFRSQHFVDITAVNLISSKVLDIPTARDWEISGPNKEEITKLRENVPHLNTNSDLSLMTSENGDEDENGDAIPPDVTAKCYNFKLLQQLSSYTIELAKKIESLQVVKDIRWNAGTPKLGDIGILADAVTYGRPSSMSLSHAKFSTIKPICDALEGNRSVKVLSFGAISAGNKGMKLLSPVLCNKKTNIESLSFCSDTLDRNGMKYLAKALKVNATLKALDLSGNKIGNRSTALLTDAIQRSQSLETLNLSRNCITYAGAKSIAGYLKENVILRDLNISHNSLSYEGMCLVVESLNQNLGVKLRFYRNDIGSDNRAKLQAM